MSLQYSNTHTESKKQNVSKHHSKRFYIGEPSEEHYITYRELQCFKWLVKGKTADEIAMILDISKRTVDVHCNNIKRKLDCVKLTQVAYKLALAGINDVLERI